jgi:thymidylate kinase
VRKIIVFSGLDCSGKSTQIEFLDEIFSKKGQKSLVFWSRGGYTPGFQKLKNILRYFVGKKLPKPGLSPQREKALANSYIRRIWLTISMLDLIFCYTFYLRFKYLFNYNIICDRYLMDTNIDFKLAYPQDNTETWFLWKLLKYTALKPDFHFVSTIPVSEAVIRSKFKFEPFPDSPETLEKRLHLYNEELITNKNLIHIDGMKDVNQIKKHIFQTVSIL